jgi:hypothetical protein
LTRDEKIILEALDAAVRCEPTATHIDGIVSLVEQKLSRRPDDLLAWKPIPLSLYSLPLPDIIRSSWVFILRSNTVTGAERHPNSHQRMMSYRGAGDFQTRTGGPWCSHRLRSDPAARIEERWISIPPNVWHQGVVAETNWIVVSFHTVPDDELIEERPDPGLSNAFRRRKYVGESKKSP